MTGVGEQIGTCLPSFRLLSFLHHLLHHRRGKEERKREGIVLSRRCECAASLIGPRDRFKTDQGSSLLSRRSSPMAARSFSVSYERFGRKRFLSADMNPIFLCTHSLSTIFIKSVQANFDRLVIFVSVEKSLELTN